MVKFSKAALMCALVCASSLMTTSVHAFSMPLTYTCCRTQPTTTTRLSMSYDPMGRRMKNGSFNKANGLMNVQGLQPDQAGSSTSPNGGRGNSIFPSSFTERPSPAATNANTMFMYDQQQYDGFLPLKPDQDDGVRYDSSIFQPSSKSRNNNNNNNGYNYDVEFIRARQISADQDTRVRPAAPRNMNYNNQANNNINYGNGYNIMPQQRQSQQYQYRVPSTYSEDNRPKPKGVSGLFQRQKNNQPQRVDGIRLDQDNSYTTLANNNNGYYVGGPQDNGYSLVPQQQQQQQRQQRQKPTYTYRNPPTAKSNGQHQSRKTTTVGGLWPFGQSQKAQKISGNGVYVRPPASPQGPVNKANSFGPGFPDNMARSTPVGTLNTLSSEQIGGDRVYTRNGGAPQLLGPDQDDVRNSLGYLGYVEAAQDLQRLNGDYVDARYQQQQRGGGRYQRYQGGGGGGGYYSGGGGGGRMGGYGGNRQMGGGGYPQGSYEGKPSLNRDRLYFGKPPLTTEQRRAARRAEEQRQFRNNIGKVAAATFFGVPLALAILPNEVLRDPMVKKFPQNREQIDRMANFRMDVDLKKFTPKVDSMKMPAYFPTAEDVREQMNRAGISISEGAERIDNMMDKMSKSAPATTTAPAAATKVETPKAPAAPAAATASAPAPAAAPKASAPPAAQSAPQQATTPPPAASTTTTAPPKPVPPPTMTTTSDPKREATIKEIERIRAELAAVEAKRKALETRPVVDAISYGSSTDYLRYIGGYEGQQNDPPTGGYERQQNDPPTFGGYDSSLF